MSWIDTEKARDAVRGRETDILDAMGIPWRRGAPHIDCPYPSHGGRNDWRWDSPRALAHCSCNKTHDIFKVAMLREGITFADAKKMAAEIIGRSDLIVSRQVVKSGHPEKLFASPAELRDDSIVRAYLANRLGITCEAVLMPATRAIGLRAHAYYEPPSVQGGRAVHVGDFPCVVFQTKNHAGITHAHRIYVAPGGRGKAELGTTASGGQRTAKKSAKNARGVNIGGCSVIWGDPATAEWLILAEGIETAAAIAYSFASEIQSGALTVVSAISAGGIEAFAPWAATKRVTVAADRDEADAAGRPASCTGEKAAQKFVSMNASKVAIAIALPGQDGEKRDWLDVLRAEGVEGVRAGILAVRATRSSNEIVVTKSSIDLYKQKLEEVGVLYPLPMLSANRLVYDVDHAKRVRVHKISRSKQGDEMIVPVATPFGVAAKLRYSGRDDYGLRIAVESMDGTRRFVDVERAKLAATTTSSDVIKALFAAGLRTEGDGPSLVLDALRAADPKDEIVVLSSAGWHHLADQPGPIFVCPDGTVLGAGTPRIEMSAAARLPPEVTRGGTLEAWKRATDAAAAVEGCQHWLLGVIAGFAGPIVALCGFDTCGINWSGLSTAGKTLSQRLSVSAWTIPLSTKRESLLQPARATVNGIEAIAARASGTVLGLDELGHMDGREIHKLIYALTMGAGKVRLTADASLRPSYTWSSFIIFSAETSLEERIRADGGKWTAGLAVRVPDIDVTAVNRSVDGETLAQIESVRSNFGLAGPEFVSRLIAEGVHRDPEALRYGINQVAAQIAGQTADSAKIRSALPFAILMTAGRLAFEYGLISVNATAAVMWAWDKFMGSSDAAALAPADKAVELLREWIAEKWDSSILNVLPGVAAVRDAKGWYDDHTVYLTPVRLMEATGNVLKEIEVAKILDSKGYLTKKKDSSRRTHSYVPHIGTMKVYALSRKALGRNSGQISLQAVGS